MKIELYENGRLKVFEVSEKYVILIFGIILLPFKWFLKSVVLKGLVILLIWIQGLCGDPALFYSRYDPKY
jgi:hypothetical protein